jgi:hypothetical protein
MEIFNSYSELLNSMSKLTDTERRLLKSTALFDTAFTSADYANEFGKALNSKILLSLIEKGYVISLETSKIHEIVDYPQKILKTDGSSTLRNISIFQYLHKYQYTRHYLLLSDKSREVFISNLFADYRLAHTGFMQNHYERIVSKLNNQLNLFS